MKICRDCSNVCEGSALSCVRCGSNNLAVVGEKLCTYCKMKIAVGTIICPHCHRVLPPESQYATVGTTNVVQPEEKNVVESENVKVVQPIQPFGENATKATTYQENIGETQSVKEASDKQAVRAKNMDEFNRNNPLFAIYDKTPDILPVKQPIKEESETEEVSEEILQEETVMTAQEETEKFNKTGAIETREFTTGTISRENIVPQSRLPRYIIFLCGFVCAIVGLWCNYILHDFGDVVGYQMFCSILVDFRDVFPGTYPYILYGSNLLTKYEVWGSYMPFAINAGLLVSLAGGITMMITIIPKWITVVLNIIALALQIFGACLIGYLFGTSALGLGAYALIFGALGVALAHVIFVKKVYRLKKKVNKIKN